MVLDLFMCKSKDPQIIPNGIRVELRSLLFQHVIKKLRSTSSQPPTGTEAAAKKWRGLINIHES